MMNWIFSPFGKVVVFGFMVFGLSCCELYELFEDPEPKTELEKLPPATQTGEETFGCLVNGRALYDKIAYRAIYQGGVFQFSNGYEDASMEEDVGFILLDPLEINKNYDLTDTSKYRAYYKYRTEEQGVICRDDFENTFDGYLKFSKIDRKNYIVSGTFEFSTVPEGCDTIHVTDGRFDLKYTP